MPARLSLRAATFSGGTVDFGSAEGNINANTNLTFSTASVTGTNGLTISGAGKVEFDSTDTYAGTTTYNGAGIMSGTLSVGSVGSLSSGSLTWIGGSLFIDTQLNPNFAVIGNAITLNNSVVNLGVGDRITLTGPITLFGTDTLLSSTSTLIRSAIGGPGTLAIDGGGSENALLTTPLGSIVITLEGTSTYTGGTLLNPGVNLCITNSSALGTGPINWLGGIIEPAAKLTQATPVQEPGGAAITLSNTINFANSSVTITNNNGPDSGGIVTLAGPVNVSGASDTLTLNTTAINGNQNTQATAGLVGAINTNVVITGQVSGPVR